MKNILIKKSRERLIENNSSPGCSNKHTPYNKLLSLFVLLITLIIPSNVSAYWDEIRVLDKDWLHMDAGTYSHDGMLKIYFPVIIDKANGGAFWDYHWLTEGYIKINDKVLIENIRIDWDSRNHHPKFYENGKYIDASKVHNYGREVKVNFNVRNGAHCYYSSFKNDDNNETDKKIANNDSSGEIFARLGYSLGSRKINSNEGESAAVVIFYLAVPNDLLHENAQVKIGFKTANERDSDKGPYDIFEKLGGVAPGAGKNLGEQLSPISYINIDNIAHYISKDAGTMDMEVTLSNDFVNAQFENIDKQSRVKELILNWEDKGDIRFNGNEITRKIVVKGGKLYADPEDITLKAKTKINDFIWYEFNKSTKSKAYPWPEDINLENNGRGTIHGLFVMPARKVSELNNYVTGDNFDVQRSTTTDFSDAITITSLPYHPDSLTYRFDDNISDLGKEITLYYRLRRSHSMNDWEWKHSVNKQITLTQELASVTPTGLEKTKDIEGKDEPSKFEVAKIKWTFNDGVWPEGTELVIYRRNMTRSGEKVDIAHLSHEEAMKGAYYDESITAYNRMEYTLQIVLPSGLPYDAPKPIKVPGDIVTTEMGTLSNLNISKGYFSDRVELRWASSGGFDGYRIRRTEYGAPADEAVLISTVSSGGDNQNILAEDTKGVPGIYYTYYVDGYIKFENKNLYSDVLTAVGFRSPTGNIYGRITFENGQAVSGVDLFLESDQKLNGQSMYFDGNDDYLKVDKDIVIGNEFTVQAYVYPDMSKNNRSVIINKNDVYELALDNGKIEFTCSSDIVSAETKNFATDNYTHVTAVRAKDSLYIYINGDIAAKINATSSVISSESVTYIGRNADGSFYKGNIDEVRIWNKALTAEMIEQDYTRQLYGGEKGLVAYWRFNDGIADEFYDLSFGGTKHNCNHGVIYGAVYDDNIPTQSQLGLKGITNDEGYYEINGIPYIGTGTTYRIIPVYGTHQFDPTEQKRLISEGALSHTCDFKDKSSFPVSGYVYYKDTNFPVKDAMFKVDGKTVVEKNGTVNKTDENGKFTISVPVGVHEVKVYKQNHEFVNDGRITDKNGNDRNYNEPLYGVDLRDSTLVKFIGRVAGGAVQEAYALGHSLSKNNLSDRITITMKLPNEKYMLNNGEEDIEKYEAAFCPSNVTDIDKWNNEHKSVIKYPAKKNFIEITPDLKTGEFTAMVIPESFILSANADGYGEVLGNTVLDLSNTFVEKTSINEYVDSVETDGKMVYTNYSDTLKYNADYKIIKRLDPTLAIQQIVNGRATDYFGNNEIRVNTMDGSIVRLNNVNENNGEYLFKHPIFTQRTKYTFKVSAFEEYIKYKEGKASEEKDRVPVTDGIASFANNLSITESTDTLHLNDKGEATYTFVAGKPNIANNIGLKLLEVSLDINNKIIKWGDGIQAYILGSVPNGTRFVTRGPNQLLFILRDPPGSHSYSYIEEGLTYDTDARYVGGFDQEGDEEWATFLGGKIVTFTGVGAGMITTLDMENSTIGGIIHRESGIFSDGYTESYNFSTAFRTSDSPDFVGADGDLFVGKSTNLEYGSATCMNIIPKKNFSPGQNADGAVEIASATDRDGKEYIIVRDLGIEMGIDFGTMYAYPQAHIENVLIPELVKLRNEFILPNTMSRQEAQNVADSKNVQMYLSKLDADDPNFGKDNRDDAFKNMPGFEKFSPEDGPSYITITPNNELSHNDTIVSFNQQIRSWHRALERNEREKVRSQKLENYSFHAGSQVEYSREYVNADVHTEDFTFVIGAKFAGTWALKNDNKGLQFRTNQSLTHNSGGSYDTSHGNVCKSGFLLADEGSVDYHSVDVCSVPMYDQELDEDSIEGTDSYKRATNFIFKLKGGVTSCPFEDEYKTKYFEPGKHLLDQRTAKVEVPVIQIDSASTAIANNIPQTRKAVYKINLLNASEVKHDCIYDLNVVQESNPNGAKLFIDGAPIGNGLSFLIPADKGVTKTLEVGIGNGFDYNNLQLVLHSQCDDISDVLDISAHFVPACTDINLVKPVDKWVLNSDAMDDEGNYMLHVRADGYDVNYPNFECVKIMYKPSSASDADKVTAMTYYVNKDAYEKAQGNKMMIPDGGLIDYDFNMASLPDQSYDIWVEAVGSNNVKTVSNIASGIKDTMRPRLFGAAQPANGILGVEDEIRLNFNEEIAEGLLTQKNFEVTGTRNGELVTRAASVRFDGTNDYLTTEVERNLENKDFTVETALYVDKLEHDGTVFSHGNVNSSFEITITTERKLKVTIGKNEYVTDNEIDMKQGEWEHLAVVYSCGNNPRISVFYNKKNVMDKPATHYTGVGNIEIGRSITNGNYFCGKLSEMRIWDKALSLGTLNKNKDISLKGSEIGLIGYYPMNECSGNLVIDKARGANAIMKDAQWFINRQGYAAKFDGNSYLRLYTDALSISNDMDYTIEFWFKGEPGQKDAALFANGRGDNEEQDGSESTMYIGFDENGKLVMRSNGYAHVVENGDYLDNAWHHFALAVNRNINRANIVVDGKLNTYFDASALDKIDAPNAYLGARGWYPKGTTEAIIDHRFRGAIDEFRIWNMYKNEAIINNESNINLKGSEMGLFTYYPFETYKSWQGVMDMEFTTSDMTLRGETGPEISDAVNVNVVETRDSAPVKNRGAIAPVMINFVVNKDALIISPDAPNGWDDFEESIVTFKVKDIKDIHRNSIKNPIAWSAYIDRNLLRWSEDELNISKAVYEEMEFSADILNLGGSAQNYSIENMPSWLEVSPNAGNIDPKSSVHVKFVIDEGLNIGTYNETLYLVNENGVARALTLNIKVKGEKPDWKVNPADYKYNMSVYGKLRINNIFSTDKEDMIAAFLNGKCVGVTQNNYFKNEDMWYAFITVYGNEVQQDGLEFRIWDDSSGKIYFAQGNKGSMPFVNNKIYGTPDDPVIFDGEELMYQDIALNAGWNWISFNLHNDNLSDVNATLSNGTWSNNDEAKNDKYTDSYSEQSHKWFGSLSKNGGFNNTSMFMIRSEKEQVLSLYGKKINTFDMPVNVNPNWNYIGYMLPFNMTVTEALADYKAETGDVIKSQTTFAMYSEKNTWVGNLNYMEANRGYMLYRNPSADAVSFRYPANQGSLSNKETLAPRVMTTDASTLFSDNMSVIATSGSSFDIISGDVIKAYVNGEQRGMAQLVNIGDDETVWFINISGENEAGITFVVERDGKKVAVTEPTMKYRSDDIQGSLEKPVVLDFINAENNVNVYPRIFDSFVNVTVIQENITSIKVYVYDLQGQIVKEFAEGTSDDMVIRKLDLSSLAQGFYMIGVSVNNGEPSVFKVEKK